MNTRYPVDAGAAWLSQLAATSFCLWTAACVNAQAAVVKIEYERDIRPILSENCYACHGPDEGKRKAGLRLDRKEDAFKSLKSGEIAIVAGDTAKSELIRRISTTDADDKMLESSMWRTRWQFTWEPPDVRVRLLNAWRITSSESPQ